MFPEAFSSIQYRGTRTYNPPTDFSGLLRSLEQQLDNNTTRSPRSASVIYKALLVATSNSINQHLCHFFTSSRPKAAEKTRLMTIFPASLRLFLLTFLQALSESFSGDIPDEQMSSNSFFPDEYFTCSSLCLSCG